MAVSGVGTVLGWSSQDFRLRFPGYVMTSSTLVEPARWLRQNLPETAVVASRRIGVLAYEGRFEVFDDCFGLTEPEVAQMIRRGGLPIDLPSDPRLAELWRRRSPDFVLEDAAVIAALPTAAGEIEIHGLRYRQARSFRIARGVDWVLLARAESQQPGPYSSRTVQP
jgi:hypothetical protein